MSDEQFTPHTVPFIPNIEGVYKQRFYQLVSSWKASDLGDAHVAAIEKELTSLSETPYRSDQSDRYRAILLLLRDLLSSTWIGSYEYGQLILNTYSTTDMQRGGASNTNEAKRKLQQYMEPARLRVIEENRDFILAVEAGKWNKQTRPIASLISDGRQLFKLLTEVNNGSRKLEEVVDPVIQLVDESIDPYTGLRLLDIWRYFRYTWSSPAENTPGRSMQFLIRNKAMTGSPVMGISSLDNCALAMGPRDDYLGWTAPAFVRTLLSKGYTTARILETIDSFLDLGIQGINIRGSYLRQEHLKHPNLKIIQKLLVSAQSAKKQRRSSLSEDEFHAGSEESKSLLFEKKRKEKLAKLLDARRQINEFVEASGDLSKVTPDALSVLYPVFSIALQSKKEEHIGSSLLELNVCGAVPPYNYLLAGKLVALCALSPFVIDSYKARYRDRPSEIASQMLGEEVIRRADLVYVGTTSLYSVGSSQYNRLTIPKEAIGSSFDLRYQQLSELTQGFGTFHISRKTTEALELVLDKSGSQTVNHQFGEGASPKLRLLGEAIRNLLKSDGISSPGVFTSHAMPRIIYAAPLVSNCFEYLLGLDKNPRYYESKSAGDSTTQKIIDFWRDRWLRMRLRYEPALAQVSAFSLSKETNQHLVGHLLSTDEPRDEQQMTQTTPETGSDEVTSQNRTEFLRRFYKSSSAFADSTSLHDLEGMHVRTSLDDAVLNVVKKGRDCVLTGNPGDGKTHLIKVLEKRIKKINSDISPVYDASTMTTGEILNAWKKARAHDTPFVIAINAAVLYEVAHDKKAPPYVVNAFHQFENGIILGDTSVDTDESVVVFNLGLRSALSADVVDGVINQMTDPRNFVGCKKCQFCTQCGFLKHARLISSDRFRERIKAVFQRIELVGVHVTVRDLQSFFSYLIFWNHGCKTVVKESELDDFRIENLMYEKGKGSLFKVLRETFDPARVSLPVIDEKLVVGEFDASDWQEDADEPKSAVDDATVRDFNRRKRAFYFFHKDGACLLKNTSREPIARFEEFLNAPEKKQLKDILGKIRAFVGEKTSGSSDSFPVWRAFRYDNSPRRILISVGRIPKSDFTIRRPRLLDSMAGGISMSPTYVELFEIKSKQALKIDYAMFRLLEYAGQKIPVWALEENNEAKKLWRFFEYLQPENSDDEERTVTIYDLKRNESTTAVVDLEDHRYTEIIAKENR